MNEHRQVFSTKWFRQSLAVLHPTVETQQILLAVVRRLEHSATSFAPISGTEIRLVKTKRHVALGREYPALRVFFFVNDDQVLLLWAEEYDEMDADGAAVLNAIDHAAEQGSPPAVASEGAQEVLEQFRFPSRRPLRAFLSYCREDYEAVRQLYERLRTSGIEVWFDDVALLPGQEWQSEIHNAVRRSDVVIVCLSQRAIKKVGFVQREIHEALEYAVEHPPGTVFVIPVRLDDCTVPPSLKHLHYVDLWSEKGYQKLLLSLTQRSLQIGD